jgi:hypothetical protein
MSNSSALLRALAVILNLAMLSTSQSAAVPWHLEAEPERQPVAPRPLSASDLASDQGAYLNKMVRVRSQVSRVFGRHAFVLSDEPLLAAPDVLVLVPDALGKASPDYMLNVVGTVRPYNRRQLEREFSWFKADLFRGTELLSLWADDGPPVVIAQSARTAMGVELVKAAGPTTANVGLPGVVGAEQPIGGEPLKAERAITSVATVLRSEDATALIGAPVVLNGVRVQRVLDPEFVLIGGDPEHQMLVRLLQPSQDVIAGDVVALSGVLQSAPALPADWDLAGQPPVVIQARRLDRLER